jgi:hypothetical protein
MGKARDCFEAGLFLTGLLWSRRDKEPAKYEVVAEQARRSLSNLGITTGYISKVTRPPSSADDINGQLRWVNDRLGLITKDVKSEIQKSHRDIEAYCFQVGVDLGNLMFAGGLLDASLLTPSHTKDIQWLSLFVEYLRRSSIAIRPPEFVVTFVQEVQNSLSDPGRVKDLADLPGKATRVAQDLAVWIDGIPEPVVPPPPPNGADGGVGVLIAVLGSILAAVPLVGGIYLASAQRLAETKFRLFGNDFSSTSVGVSMAFIGAVLVMSSCLCK